jgi:hypothetical protein
MFLIKAYHLGQYDTANTNSGGCPDTEKTMVLCTSDCQSVQQPCRAVMEKALWDTALVLNVKLRDPVGQTSAKSSDIALSLIICQCFRAKGDHETALDYHKSV